MINDAIDNRQWWVQRWLELLDSYRFKKRLERARNYAREGHVLSMEFNNAEVIAKVQGSEAEPYQVLLNLDPFTNEDWSYIINTLAEKALYSAQLLAGQMPESIEQVFIKNGLNLFPYTLTDIRSRCSCPDKANPCKHIGAVYYQLGDRLSEDPFVMFQLRGRSKTQLLAALRQQRSQPPELTPMATPIPLEPDPVAPPSTTVTPVKPTKTKTENLQDLAKFWDYDEPLDPSLVAIAPPTDLKNSLDLLGMMPLPQEEAQEVKQFLQPLYQTVSQKALAAAFSIPD
jgi:uncharacterized Zn finger protein